MILVDSNIVIYSRQRGYDELRRQLASQDVAVCTIVQIEVLGWHLMEKADEAAFRSFFAMAMLYQLSERVIERTIELKRLKPKMHLGDAIIAATALVHKLELWTANVDDFEDIEGLSIRNPVSA